MIRSCFLVIFLSGDICVAQSPTPLVSPRSNTLIKTKEELMRFAEPKLFRLYGNEKILRENPYRITYKAGIWTMKGTLQRGEVGGTFKNWLVKRRKPTISHLLKSSTPPPGELEGARVRGDLIEFAASLESNSTHPVAKAVVALAGNTKLLKKNNIEYPAEIDKLVDIIVTISIDDKYVG